MRFSLFTLIFTLASSVNAAFIGKREVSGNVQECINELKNTQTGFMNLKDAMGPFFSNQLGTLINVKAKEADLKGNMERAKDECCQITAPVTSEESKAVLDALNSLAPELDQGVNSFVRKQIELKNFDFIQKNFKDTLNLIGDWMVPTDNCIITFSSPDVSNDIQLTISKINFSINATKRLFGI
ncbi:unnamed protein product [Rhizopus stolonifer]